MKSRMLAFNQTEVEYRTYGNDLDTELLMVEVYKMDGDQEGVLIDRWEEATDENLFHRTIRESSKYNRFIIGDDIIGDYDTSVIVLQYLGGCWLDKTNGHLIKSDNDMTLVDELIRYINNNHKIVSNQEALSDMVLGQLWYKIA